MRQMGLDEEPLRRDGLAPREWRLACIIEEFHTLGMMLAWLEDTQRSTPSRQRRRLCRLLRRQIVLRLAALNRMLRQ